jgi:hypothetical protein
MAALTDWFLIWWLRSGRYVWSRLRRRYFEGRYLSVVLPSANSLEEIEACLRQVTWTMDGLFHLFDCISYPQRVWSTKRDDCDGFAVLAAALLHHWRPETEPVLITALVSPMSQSHTVCAFKSGDNLLYFDNSSLRRGSFQSYKDIVTQFTHRARRVICWDAVRPETFEAVEFNII